MLDLYEHREFNSALMCYTIGEDVQSSFTNIIVNDLLKAWFYSSSADASNKGNCKTFPFAVQYFSDAGVSRGNYFLLFET
jgi:hypothetical protein